MATKTIEYRRVYKDHTKVAGQSTTGYIAFNGPNKEDLDEQSDKWLAAARDERDFTTVIEEINYHF